MGVNFFVVTEKEGVKLTREDEILKSISAQNNAVGNGEYYFWL